MDLNLMQLTRYSWHQSLWQQIEEAFNTNRLHHALLLWGQKGLAKREFALLLVKYLLCLSDVKACNSCRGCHWFNKEVHPDFIYLSAEKGKKNINVEQIRQLQKDLSLTRSNTTPRVILINDAEKMNIAASNALLKSLEEPSEHTMYILVADHLSTIPATIQSRAQKLYFSPVTSSQMNQYLDTHGYPIEASSLLHGAPLSAAEILSSSTMAQRNAILDDLVLLHYNEISPCVVVSKWSKLEARFVCRILYEWFSDLIKLSNRVSSTNLINKQRGTELMGVLKKSSYAQFFLITDKLILLMKHISFSRQVNVPLWLEDIAMSIME